MPTSLASGWPDTTIARAPVVAFARPASPHSGGSSGAPLTTASTGAALPPPPDARGEGRGAETVEPPPQAASTTRDATRKSGRMLNTAR